MTRRQSKQVSAIPFLAAIVLAVLSASTTALATDSLITVSEFAWTDKIADGQYVAKYDATAPLQPIYLWMRLRVETAAFDTLCAAGKLPIRHKWFHSLGSALMFEDTQCLTDAIPLAVGDVSQLQPLKRELDHQGFFDWRTWSMKEHIRPGMWIVRLVYADNTPVLCGDDGQQPCEFSIEID